jgi:hypothetical protein
LIFFLIVLKPFKGSVKYTGTILELFHFFDDKECLIVSTETWYYEVGNWDSNLVDTLNYYDAYWRTTLWKSELIFFSLYYFSNIECRIVGFIAQVQSKLYFELKRELFFTH